MLNGAEYTFKVSFTSDIYFRAVLHFVFSCSFFTICQFFFNSFIFKLLRFSNFLNFARAYSLKCYFKPFSVEF